MSAKPLGRLGVFGGTFDPPHLGHLILAGEALAQLGLEQVLFVLTADPPHKQHRRVTTIDDRLAMLNAAVQGQPAFQLSRVEIDRPGPHYSLDTMHLLAGEYPHMDLVYLIGGDSLHALPNWHRPAEFLAACAALGVMRRPSARIELDDLEKALPGLSAKLEFIDAPLLEIASREIRQRIKEGGHYRYYLPDAVYQLIQGQGIYR